MLNQEKIKGWKGRVVICDFLKKSHISDPRDGNQFPFTSDVI